MTDRDWLADDKLDVAGPFADHEIGPLSHEVAFEQSGRAASRAAATLIPATRTAIATIAPMTRRAIGAA